MIYHWLYSEFLFQLLPESICWQHKQHESPLLSLMQASCFLLCMGGTSALQSSGHQSPGSVNQSIRVMYYISHTHSQHFLETAIKERSE